MKEIIEKFYNDNKNLKLHSELFLIELHKWCNNCLLNKTPDIETISKMLQNWQEVIIMRNFLVLKKKFPDKTYHQIREEIEYRISNCIEDIHEDEFPYDELTSAMYNQNRIHVIRCDEIDEIEGEYYKIVDLDELFYKGYSPLSVLWLARFKYQKWLYGMVDFDEFLHTENND